MSQNSDRPEKVTVDYAALSSQAAKVGLQVGGLTLGIVLAAVFGGLWLDRLFGLKPLLTIVLVLASAPLSLWLTIRVARRAAKLVSPKLVSPKLVSPKLVSPTLVSPKNNNPPAAPGKDS